MNALPGTSSFTIKFNGRTNVLRTDTVVSQAFDPALNTIHPKKCACQAIWDTGATSTCISKRIVEECSLQPIGMAQTHTAGGIIRTAAYLVNIVLPNKVSIPSLRVVEADIHGADVLIGMDIIGPGDFAISCFEGKTVFTFRLPSIACMDFVAESNSLQTPIRHDKAMISRNALCPCGSGKKYKKCCGK
ncbi:MAG: SEC-C metal-binding domain-containing protein [Smithellaceae bacterium]|nr:SEC-C metal-binding domain-containing protein [Smithellaceae bacterium]